MRLDGTLPLNSISKNSTTDQDNEDSEIIKGRFENDVLIGTFLLDKKGVINRTARLDQYGKVLYVYENPE